MAKHELLTKPQQLHLGEVIQTGIRAEKLITRKGISEKRTNELQAQIDAGERAIDTLVRANIGLVWDRARAFKTKYPGSPDIQDLAQEGMCGLMVAVKKYDPSRGNNFSTVAYYWIHQAITRGVNKTGRLVRLPENRISDYTKMNGILSKFEEDALTPAEIDAEIKKELSLSQVQINNIRNAGGTHASLNRPMGGESDGKELMDRVGEDSPIYGAEFTTTQNDCYRILGDTILGLEGIQQKVVASHFSLSIDGKILEASAVRDAHGLSTSKYRRILNEGLIEMKKELQSKDLELLDFLVP